MKKLTGSEREFYRQFSRHGRGDAFIEITPQEVALLVAITHLDLHGDDASGWLSGDLRWAASKSFYEIGQNEVSQLDVRTESMVFDLMRKAGIVNLESPDYLYLSNLATLYRRRAKYRRILEQQPFPLADQIGPRCLLEYGCCDSRLLFSWMSWRKLAFDLDNRSAQETGPLRTILL